MLHELKTDEQPFQDIVSRHKLCEVRNDDRGFNVGDYLLLRETTANRTAYTGRELVAKVTHIQRGYGLPEGMVVMSILAGHVTLRRPSPINL